MQCQIKINDVLLKKNVISFENAKYLPLDENSLLEIIENTKRNFDLIPLNIEHDKNNKIGYVDVETLSLVDGEIRGEISVFDEFSDYKENSEFVGYSPELLSSKVFTEDTSGNVTFDEFQKIVAISGIALTKKPDIESMKFKNIDSFVSLNADEKKLIITEHSKGKKMTELEKVKAELEKQKNINKELVFKITNHHREKREEELSRFNIAGLDLIKHSLMEMKDEDFQNFVSAQKQKAGKRELTKQNHSKKSGEFDLENDPLAKSIAKQFGMEG